MTVRFRFSRPVRDLLEAFSNALLLLGASAIAVFVWSQGDQWLYQSVQRRHFAQSSAPPAAAAARETPTVDATSDLGVSLTAPLTRWIGPDPYVIGAIEIPRLGIDALIREGIDGSTLRRSVGHVDGTALPGTSGNTVLAAHRDTLFRSLRDIERGDRIIIRGRSGGEPVRYEVTSIRIVSPDAVEVMAPQEGAVLTLVTCYPFDFVGHASRRFVVRADAIY
jgi:sortase A